MVHAAGFEPAEAGLEAIKHQSHCGLLLGVCTQIGAQISDSDRRSLSRVVESWPRLSGPLKLAILAIVDAAKIGLEGDS